MSYSLVVMLELNGVSEVQYKEIMIISDDLSRRLDWKIGTENDNNN